MRESVLGAFAVAGLLTAMPARAETTECTEITTIPTVITVQGVYCLKGNLASSATSGTTIDIQVNNVTIDMNSFKLGGLAAGPSTNAVGIRAVDRSNVKIRNGSIRGFRWRMYLLENTGTSSGHLVEDMELDGNVGYGILAGGDGIIIRRNKIVETNRSGGYRYGIFVEGNGISVVDNTIAGVGGNFGGYGYGIFASNISNVKITNNYITRITQTEGGYSHGIALTGVSRATVDQNTILDVISAIEYGILAQDSDSVIISHNKLINPSSSSDIGIAATGTSTGISCIENTIVGYSTATSGCDYASGNHTP